MYATFMLIYAHSLPFFASRYVLLLHPETKKKEKMKNVKKNAVETYVEIENGVIDTYKAIEKGVVNGYKTVENAVVGTYKKIENSAVDFGKSLLEEYDRLRQK